ncbi:allantoate amidohydrolase [Alloacidobacterium dinghuense]|uniref:Allantoate amidohydrolase n=1 Tax=Alloacidobacterium dinghuense TaxID=2763107 RepID=A0A7G8BQC4_9BACT|nr:allantoate amidohydrolase [Alloacidobacterium dinghuense]
MARDGAATILVRCKAIAACTDKHGEILRTFLSPAMEEVHQRMRPWFEAAGMTVNVDRVGNFRAFYLSAADTDSACLLIGSHLDTVPNAGAYDGVLGVLMGLALVEALGGRRLPYSIEVIGFSDEEGTRFGVPFIGSQALVNRLDDALLNCKDANGIMVGEALTRYRAKHPKAVESSLVQNTKAYIEFHIEQGPVLESKDMALGVVEALAGQRRCRLVFHGSPGHAGTTPMMLRRDALAAAAEWITRVEMIASEFEGLVATVGQVFVEPGGVNVIPGVTRCSLDVRHADDVVCRKALEAILNEARVTTTRRGLTVDTAEYHTQPAVHLNPTMVALAENSVRQAGYSFLRMTSGAGHDAMVIAPHLPSAMLFLRSPGGISHHPDESVLKSDVAAAIHAGLCFLDNVASFLNDNGGDLRA